MYRYIIPPYEVRHGLDPTTFAPTLYHDLIEWDYNNLKVVPKREISVWLDTTLKGRYKIISDKDGFYFEFESDKDKEWFVLRWV